MKTKIFSVTLIACAALLLSACKKDGANSTLQIRMTDAPAAFTEVNIDLKQVEVKFATDSGSWVALQTTPGIYNLLGLQNGVDTLLATGTVQAGTVQELRFILGPNNTVVVGGVSFPLTIPSGSESGLKIKVGKNINAGLDSLLVDFDAALSIKLEGGSYKLRPVLRIK